MDFHSLARVRREYNLLWPLKCGGGPEFPKRKGFQTQCGSPRINLRHLAGRL